MFSATMQIFLESVLKTPRISFEVETLISGILLQDIPLPGWLPEHQPKSCGCSPAGLHAYSGGVDFCRAGHATLD